MFSCRIILTFGANAKLLNFTEKLKTASDKCRMNIVAWSSLPFAVNVILNPSYVLPKRNVVLKPNTEFVNESVVKLFPLKQD